MIPTLVLCSLLCGVSVEVTQLDGQQFTGDLGAWDGTKITLAVDGTDRTVSTEQLLKLDFTRPVENTAEPPPNDGSSPMLVKLTCGSKVAAASITTSQGQIRAMRIDATGALAALTLPQASLSSVRLRAPSAALNKSWEELSNMRHDGDALIIRKSDKALDYLVGIISNVTDEQLTFELDGEGIEVNLSKLEGFVLYHKTNRRLADPICQVATNRGDLWNVQMIDLKDGFLKFTTPCQVATSINLNEVARIGFAAGNVAYLSDVSPNRMLVTPLVTSGESLDSITTFLYEPRRNESFQGTPLSLRQEDGSRTRFPKGLAVHSKSELLYRLDGDHRRLRGIVGIDPSVASNAEVRLRIGGNERTLFEKTIVAHVAPVVVDLDIENVRRLKIEVDYGDGSDIGDRLHLCNLRTTK